MFEIFSKKSTKKAVCKQTFKETIFKVLALPIIFNVILK